MKTVIFAGLILSSMFGLLGCSENPEPSPQPEPIRTFMLAIVQPPDQVPFDFEADEAIGDYNSETGLLRIQGTSLFNGADKIEITIKNAGDTVPGTYSIGRFGSSSANVRAEFLDATNVWNARSLSGSLKITKFEPTQNGVGYLLSATFSFTAEATGGEVKIQSGEIENAVILEG